MPQPPHVPALIHIGFTRTGTTTIQRHFFPKLRGCGYLAREGPGSNPVYRTLAANLCEAGDDDYVEHTIRAFLAEKTDGHAKALVLSDENLCGKPWRGKSQPERVADRLHRLLPEARIFICVRHQGARLRSLYAFYVKVGGYATFRQYLARPAPGFEFDLDALGYDTLVERYQALFGREHVKVVAFEHFLRDPSAFLTELAAFIPAELPSSFDPTALPTENQAVSRPSRWLLRQSNRVFRQTHYNPRPWIADSRAAHLLPKALERVERGTFSRTNWKLRPADEEMLARLLPRFEASNVRLARLTGLDLADLDYPLPATT